MRIVKCCVCSALFSGTHTWTMRWKLDILKNSLKFMDTKTNTEVLDILGMKKLLTEFTNKQMKHVGRVKRHPTRMRMKSILEVHIDEKRARGKEWYKWENNISCWTSSIFPSVQPRQETESAIEARMTVTMVPGWLMMFIISVLHLLSDSVYLPRYLNVYTCPELTTLTLIVEVLSFFNITITSVLLFKPRLIFSLSPTNVSNVLCN